MTTKINYAGKTHDIPSAEKFNGPYTESVSVDENYCHKVGTAFYFENGNLYALLKTERFAKSEELPGWFNEGKVLVRFTDKKPVVESVDGNGYVVHDRELLESSFYDGEALDYFLSELFKKNPYVYLMIQLPKPQGVYGNTRSLASGIWGILEDPKKCSVIETLAKTVSVKTAWLSLLNGIEVGKGKRAAILTEDVLKDIKILKLDAYISDFQTMVSEEIISMQELREILLGLKYVIKLKMTTHGAIDTCFCRYLSRLVDVKANLKVIIEKTLLTFLTLGNISNPCVYNGSLYQQWTFNSIFNHYADAILMLPEDIVSKSASYSSNNVENFHIITSRNSKIMQTPRAEEFAAAVEKLRKLRWENDEYVIAPMQSEQELFYVGERYNNCLPVYRNKIIDDGAIVLCIYEKNSEGQIEDCPVVVFETSPYLDIYQIKTFNDEDVTDVKMIELIREWKDSKRYLLTKGRSVYRDAEAED
jgi:hypothetical protein